MKTIFFKSINMKLIALFVLFQANTVISQEQNNKQDIDKKVKSFIDEHRGEWRDLNVPETDGKLLYDIIVKNKYIRALEIGTSTGFSGIWIAWALSKTGGKLITVEIDERRYKEALAHFEEDRKSVV